MTSLFEPPAGCRTRRGPRSPACASAATPSSTGRKLSSSRDARPFATRGPTTREGVGLKSGALLVREWNGRLERVMILDDGCAWNGCVYRSLSQVAKAITGTNWNGHRFFGLKAVRTGASNRKRNVTPAPFTRRRFRARSPNRLPSRPGRCPASHGQSASRRPSCSTGSKPSSRGRRAPLSSVMRLFR